MAEKKQLKEPETEAVGDYFLSDKKDIDFIPSGCYLLDKVLGGGWAMGRIGNVVGDKSAGKTLLAIEAAANFAIKFPNPETHKIIYQEAESAFDVSYAAALGMPVERVEFLSLENTVEALFEQWDGMMRHPKAKTAKKLGAMKTAAERGFEHCFYIIDSLDALSDRAEMLRDIDDGTYGANKASKMSQMFRRVVKDLEACGITVLIVSQIRDKIGVTFGETKTRSGGKALDFYASQVLWLAEIGKRKKSVLGVERPYGVNVRARCKKNKVGMPFRECDYVIEFCYGIDDLTTHLEFLASTTKDKAFESVELKKYDLKKGNLAVSVKKFKKFDAEEWLSLNRAVRAQVGKTWLKIEKGFMPIRRKY